MSELLVYSMTIIWIIFYVIGLIVLYRKCSKPYVSEFLENTYDKLPSNLNPSEISMLLYKNINSEVFTSVFLILIKKNIIKLVEEKEDYIFVYEKTNNLTPSQKHLIFLLFECIGEDSRVKLSQIMAYCNTHSGCSSFLSEYKMFKRSSFKDVRYKFYENKVGYSKLKKFTILSIVIMLLNLILKVNFYPIYLLVFPVIFMYYYFYKIFKRTPKANTEYFKWIGYKNYLVNKSDLKEDDKEIIYVPLLGIEKLTQIQDTLMHKVHKVFSKCILKATLNGDRSIRFKWEKLK
jgi:Predicted membrane protein (DUF2207).